MIAARLTGPGAWTVGRCIWAYLAISTATESVPPILHNLVMVRPCQWRGSV